MQETCLVRQSISLRSIIVRSRGRIVRFTRSNGRNDFPCLSFLGLSVSRRYVRAMVIPKGFNKRYRTGYYKGSLSWKATQRVRAQGVLRIQVSLRVQARIARYLWVLSQRVTTRYRYKVRSQYDVTFKRCGAISIQFLQVF